MGKDRFKSRSTSRRRNTFGSGAGAYVTLELQNSLAWKSLSGSGKELLLEMLTLFSRLTNGDKKYCPEFTFTWGHCKATLCKESFYKARGEILDRGFFLLCVEGRDLRPGSPARFCSSPNWCKYKPPDVDKKRATRRAKAKERELRDNRDRKTDFLQGLKNRNGSEKPTDTKRRNKPNGTEKPSDLT